MDQALYELNRVKGPIQTDLNALLRVVASKINEVVSRVEEQPSNEQFRERQNNGLSYRPSYDFGRIYLTDNDKQHITEHVRFTVEGYTFTDRDIDILEDLRQSGKLDINTYGNDITISEGQAKPFPHELSNIIRDIDLFMYDDDWHGNNIVSDRTIKMAEALKPYEKQLNLLNIIAEGIELDTWSKDSNFTFMDMLDEYMNNFVEDNGQLNDDYNIKYSYTDDRQLELFPALRESNRSREHEHC